MLNFEEFKISDKKGSNAFREFLGNLDPKDIVHIQYRPYEGGGIGSGYGRYVFIMFKQK